MPALIRESGHHAEIADLLATVIQTRRAAYRRVLNRAIARHDLHPDVDQEVIIDLLVGPLWTRLLITRQPVTQALVEEIVDAVLRAYPPRRPRRRDGNQLTTEAWCRAGSTAGIAVLASHEPSLLDGV